VSLVFTNDSKHNLLGKSLRIVIVHPPMMNILARQFSLSDQIVRTVEQIGLARRHSATHTRVVALCYSDSR